MVDAGLTVIQDSIGSATPENTGELIKFSHANNNNNNNNNNMRNSKGKVNVGTEIVQTTSDFTWLAT